MADNRLYIYKLTPSKNMTDNYFESEQFQHLLRSYEDDKANGRPIFMEAEDFADLGDYYLYANRPEECETALNHGLTLFPDDEALLSVLNSCYIFQHRFDEAEKMLERLDQSTPDSLYQLAQLAFAKYDNIEKAEDYWRQWMNLVHEDDPSDDAIRDCYVHIVASYIELAEPAESMFEENRGCPHARRWIKQYMQKFQPLGDSDYDVQLVDLLTPFALSDMVIEIMPQILEQRPYLPGGWSRLSRAYAQLNKFEDSNEAADFALAIDENDMDALLTKAHSLQMLGQNKACIPYFEKYLDNGGDKSQIVPLANACFMIHDNERGHAWAKAITAQLDKDHKLYTSRKTPQDVKDRIEETYASFGGFIDYYVRCMQDLTMLYSNLMLDSLTLRTAVKVLHYRREDADLYYVIGQSLIRLQRMRTASRAFELAFRCADDPIWMCVRIAMCFVQVNCDEMGEHLLDLALTLSDKKDTTDEVMCKAYLLKAIIALKGHNKLDFKEAIRQMLQYDTEEPQILLGYGFPKGMPVEQWEDYIDNNFESIFKKLSDLAQYID